MAPDIGLDLKLSTTKIITNFSRQASSIQDSDKRIAKLEDYIRNLEEEKRKIEVFKRELPLCFFLLDDVIYGMKDEVERCKNGRNLKEFMPVENKLENEGGVKLETVCKDEKMSWMSSAQLWSDNYSDDNHDNKIKIKINKDINKNDSECGDESDHRQESETPSLESKSKGFGGAFVPFKGTKVTVADGGLPDLSLVSRPAMVLPEKPIARSHVSVPASSHASLQSPQQQLELRKSRRCWSPELHRRFVLALQQLGGAQVATPKQIRELMKVDGLTNDEVKSHLQKYRLHTRRLPNSSSSMNRQPVMVMGGLWASQDEQNYTKSHEQSASQSGSPQGPLQLNTASSSRAMSVNAGDSCDEDGKSESYSWK